MPVEMKEFAGNVRDLGANLVPIGPFPPESVSTQKQ
jgi:hypothetical protein